MKNDTELAKKNLEISFEFSRYLLTNPDLESKIPDNALIVFEVADDPDLTLFNRTLAQRTKETNQPVVTVWIKGLAATRLAAREVLAGAAGSSALRILSSCNASSFMRTLPRSALIASSVTCNSIAACAM